MASRNLEYAFRLTSYESGEPAGYRQRLSPARARVAQQQSIKPQWGWQIRVLTNQWNALHSSDAGRFTLIYNNFVSKISFGIALTCSASQHVDASKTIYYKRGGDALWHLDTAVQLFFRERVYMFSDFTHEHTLGARSTITASRTSASMGWHRLGTPHAETDRLRSCWVMHERSKAPTCAIAREDINRASTLIVRVGAYSAPFSGTVHGPNRPEVLSSYCMRYGPRRSLTGCLLANCTRGNAR